MGQRTLESHALQASISEQGYSFIEHHISPEMIDDLVKAYAVFTDNHPDPEPATLERMITNPRKLDELDLTQDNQHEWHKYRTNHPQFAKPGGYTNRSAQVHALHLAGRDILKDGEQLTDDPKEYFHFHPNGLHKMQLQHEQNEWGPVPPEVTTLHTRFIPIYDLARLAVMKQSQLLEENHPELFDRYMRPKDLDNSPMRLVFYHHGQGEYLAGGHYDKSSVTIQIAESHMGLRVRNPQTGAMEPIRRDDDTGVFFMGKLWEEMYPDSELNPGWHEVTNMSEVNGGRQLHGRNCARWALISFSNVEALEIPTKATTHIEASVSESLEMNEILQQVS